MTADSKILDAQPITEREDRLLMAARDALVMFELVARLVGTSLTNEIAAELRAALDSYKDRP